MNCDAGGTVIYLALGLLVYLLGYGPVDWSDGWVYVIVALWPFVVIWWCLFYILAIGAAFLLIGLSVTAWGHFRSKT